MSYGLFGPIRLTDKREAVFISSSLHIGCCQEATVLFEDGHIEIVNPDDIHSIPKAPHSFDPDWYWWYRKKIPVKGWARFAALKVAADEYITAPLEVRVQRCRDAGEYAGPLGSCAKRFPYTRQAKP